MDLFKPSHRLTARNVVKVGGAKPKAVKPLGKLTQPKLAAQMKRMLKGSGVHNKVLKSLNGMGFWSDIWDGIKSMGEKALPMITPIVTELIKKKVSGGAKKPATKPAVKKVIGSRSNLKGKGKKVDGRKARALIVKKVMKEQGLPMIKASAYVKQHKLY